MSSMRVFGCEHEFVGREGELDRIIAAAHAGSNLTILAAPGVGSSELLKQAYEELFLSESVLPFYFDPQVSSEDASATPARFGYEFLVQALAYELRDPRLIAIRPPLDEISRLVPPSSGWIDTAIELLLSHPDITNCLGLVTRPRRRVAVLIDGLDSQPPFGNVDRFIEAIASLGDVSVIASGRRRELFGRLRFGQMMLEPLSFSECVRAIRSMTDHRQIDLNQPTRDLIAIQTEGSLRVVDLLLAQARDMGGCIDDFAALERVYTESIFGGRLARYINDRIFQSLNDTEDQDRVIHLLGQTLASDGKRLSIDHWRRAMRGIDGASVARIVHHLNVEEIISVADGSVSMRVTPRVIQDLIRARVRLLKAPEKRAAIVGRAMVHYLDQAPRLMTKFYRSNASIGVRGLLKRFNKQSVGTAAIDYGAFKRRLKGQTDEAIIAALRSAPDSVELPRIMYTADAAAIYPNLAELSDIDRSTVGLTESGEAWFVAEIDSKLETDDATAEFWCDRLEMAAVNSGFDRYRLWLIAPEGFTDSALDILEERETYGSSRKQTELLRQLLAMAPDVKMDVATNYEVSIQMGEEGEMTAARTFGQIAEKHNIPSDAATQIKTALVEALINAAEHSLSPDQRVNLTFSVTAETIMITVTNRGLRLTTHILSQRDGPSERRGWGLKLIQQVMDEVRVEPTDDGTRLVMMKRLI